MGEGKQAVYWGKTQPNISGHSQAQAHHMSSSENGKGQSMIVLPENITRSSRWETGEGSGTHEEEEGVILSSGEGPGCPPAAAMKPEVGLDLSFLGTEVGCGLFEPSNKGEADSVDITPLALWDPYYVSDLVILEDDSDGSSMEEELEPSEWVRTMIKGFGTFVGFPIACCERQCIDFFQKLERVWEQQATVAATRQTSNSTQKGMRELRNLFSSINYDGHSGRGTRGSLTSSGLGSYVGQ